MSPVRPHKRLTTLEQKRLKRKVLRVIEERSSGFAKHLKETGGLNSSTTAFDVKLDAEIERFKRGKSIEADRANRGFQTMYPGKH